MYHMRKIGHSLGLLSAALPLLLSAAACGKKETETTESPATAAPTAEAAPAAPAAPDATELQQRAQGIFKPLPQAMEAAGRALSPEKIALGRQLYYEKRLSKGHDLSCNSCHDLNAYGTDSRAGASGKFSQGHKGQLGGRNSPTSYNAALHIAQFWDGRAPDVEAQAKGPVLNPVEMALPDGTAAVKALKSIPGYKALFAAAFPDQKDPITFDNMATAIGAFERKLVTSDRFDKFLRGDKAALNDTELKGLATFMDAGCIACHNGPGVGGGLYQKLGLLKPYPTQDVGRFEVTKNEADKQVFKVPSLRNIEKTAPYFHDGSQGTLTDAVKAMAEYQTAKGKLSDEEVANIVAFLKSLTGELPVDYIKEPASLASSKATPKPQG
jgi:cytochrome c peroxidase